MPTARVATNLDSDAIATRARDAPIVLDVDILLHPHPTARMEVNNPPAR